MYRLTTTHGLRLVARVEQGGLFGTRTADEVVGTRGLRAAGVPVADVVAVDEAGHVLGHPMFVMEYVDGRRLQPDTAGGASTTSSCRSTACTTRHTANGSASRRATRSTCGSNERA